MEAITEQWTGQFCGVVDTEKREKVRNILKELVLTGDDVSRIMEIFSSQMDLANSKDEAKRKQSDLLMENTHVRCLMDGTENGEYLGLDLGGTNFRVVLIKLTNGMAKTTLESFTIPTSILSGPVKEVFDFIADKIFGFDEKHGLTDRKEHLPLGFTFSFPSKQLALNSSILVTWTKNFKCPDGVGSDPVKLLEEALDRRGLADKIDVVVVMSDTTSTLLAGNYIDKAARIGVILGTGSNAAFVDHIDNIERWTGDMKDPKQVVVNIEWGCAGDNGCLDFYRTQYEKDVDCRSNHVGSFTFEKSFSGLYLGELVRMVLVKLTEEGVLFDGHMSMPLSTPWAFTTTHITDMECDKGANSANSWDVLNQLELSSHATEQDVAIMREVAAMISQRAAYIVAAAIAALVNRTQLPEVTVAIDGSLYENHPKFHGCMMDILNCFCPQTKVKLILVKDGSGLGAAFAAVSALKQNAAHLRCSGCCVAHDT